MNLENLTSNDKSNLLWLMEFIESRQESSEIIKDNYPRKFDATTWISIGYVKCLIGLLFSKSEELNEFRKSMDSMRTPFITENEPLFKDFLKSALPVKVFQEDDENPRKD